MIQLLQKLPGAEENGAAHAHEKIKRDAAWQQEARRWLRAVSGTFGVPFRLSLGEDKPLESGCRFCRMLWRATTGQENTCASGCVQTHWALHRAALDSGHPVARTCCGGLQLHAISVGVNSTEAGTIECGPFVLPGAVFPGGLSRLPVSVELQAGLLGAHRELPILDGSRAAALGEFLLCLSRGIVSAADAAIPPVGVGEPAAIIAARHFIAELATTETLTLGRAARHVGLSEDYFSKLFQRTTGLTFTDYLSRVRIEKVCHLLVTTPMGVAEMAMACGFGSVPHFNRVFRRYTGQSPTGYRREARRVRQAEGVR